jgi:hypothetical protein
VRRHVAVHDAARLAGVSAELVRGVEAARRVRDDARRDGMGDGAPFARARSTQPRERLAVEQLHDEIEDAVVLAEIEDLRHVGMFDARRDLGFGEKHALEAGIGRERGEHGLHRHELGEAARAAQARRPYDGHPAAADRSEQLVASQGLLVVERRERGDERVPSLPRALVRGLRHGPCPHDRTSPVPQQRGTLGT